MEAYESGLKVCMETSALYWHALQILHLHEPNHFLPFANIARSFRVFRFTTMCLETFNGCILISNIYRLQWVLIIGFLLSENKHCWGWLAKVRGHLINNNYLDKWCRLSKCLYLHHLTLMSNQSMNINLFYWCNLFWINVNMHKMS